MPRLNVHEMDPCVWTSVASFCIFDGYLFVDVKHNINAPVLSTLMNSVTQCCACKLWKKLLLFPFSFLTRPIPSIVVEEGLGVTSSREVFLSNSLARVALLVLRRDPSPLQVPMAKVPGDEPRHRLFWAFCSQQQGSSGQILSCQSSR